MQCEEARDQFAEYVNGSLERERRSRIDQHLMECEPCRSEAEDLQTVWIQLGTIPSSAPGPELRARFQGVLEAYEQGLAHAPSSAHTPSRWTGMNSLLAGWWPRQPALQAGLACVLMVVGMIVGIQLRPSPSVEPANQITDLRRELSDMRGMVALSLMRNESASDRLRGVNSSYQLQDPGNEVLSALIDTLLHDSNVNVRLATVDALRQFGDRPVVRRGVVDAIVREESPMVQIGLIDFVVDLHEQDAVEALRFVSENQKLDGAVRERAEKGLIQLE
jgi:hypothetical protein